MVTLILKPALAKAGAQSWPTIHFQPPFAPPTPRAAKGAGRAAA
jgi:hypothetical protein